MTKLQDLMAVTCVSPNDPMTKGGIIIGAVLATIAGFALLPQALKIRRLRSSHGLSPATMAAVVGHNTLLMADTLIVKWRIVESCADDALHCLARLLDVAQLIATVLAQVLVLVMLVVYPPHKAARYRALAFATVLVVCALVGSSAASSTAAPCSPAALHLAEAYSASASLLVLVAYCPQLYATWRPHGVAPIRRPSNTAPPAPPLPPTPQAGVPVSRLDEHMACVVHCLSWQVERPRRTLLVVRDDAASGVGRPRGRAQLSALPARPVGELPPRLRLCSHAARHRRPRRTDATDTTRSEQPPTGPHGTPRDPTGPPRNPPATAPPPHRSDGRTAHSPWLCPVRL
jgi:uncharacterized protein with PQ loop repeat